MFKRFAALALMITLPTLFAEESQLATEPVDVGIVCGSGSFYAQNFSTATQVLVFHQGTYCTWRVLAPGASFSSSYTREQLDDVTIEVANYDLGVWKTSRSFSLSALCDSGADALWIRNSGSIASWLEVSQVLTEITPGPSMLPSNLPSTAAEATAEPVPEFAPTHVPVITPVDRQQGDVPPVLGDRPLPPV
jgi:hypothetical protein